jgi:diacylglycerol kinase (ATP)
LAKIAKNAAAGAVLISAINAVLVAYLIFFDRLWPMTNMMVSRVKQSPPHTTFICIVIVMLIVIGVKAYFGRGTPLKGGMPSGHSAIAFSAATIITLISEDVLISTLSYLMALLVVQSRLESKVHSFFETVIGGIIGMMITVLIFRELIGIYLRYPGILSDIRLLYPVKNGLNSCHMVFTVQNERRQFPV